METKWTKGPWETKLGKDLRWRVMPENAHNGPSVICEMIRVESEESYPTSQVLANARLIEAAPNLYRALRVMVQEWVEEMGDESQNSTPGDVLEKARAALAQAEGGSA